jgi:hypothetical protein
VHGDAHMPQWPSPASAAPWPPGPWKLTYQETVPAGPKDDWPTCFEEWIAE